MACEEENVLLQEKLDAAAKEDTQVFVKFRKNQNFPGSAFAPLKKTRALMMLAIKDFFLRSFLLNIYPGAIMFQPCGTPCHLAPPSSQTL